MWPYESKVAKKNEPMNDPSNPYAAPTSDPSDTKRPRPMRDSHSRFWLRAFFVTASIRVVFSAGLRAATALPSVFPNAAHALDVVSNVCLGGAFVVGAVELVIIGRWLRQMWSTLPPEAWLVRGRPITPDGAGGFLMVPLYNYYWMFVMNLALCDAYEERTLRRPGPENPSGRGLVLSAGGLELLTQIGALAGHSPLSVLWLAGLAAPLFWFFYMRHVESLRESFKERSQRSPFHRES